MAKKKLTLSKAYVLIEGQFFQHIAQIDEHRQQLESHKLFSSNKNMLLIHTKLYEIIVVLFSVVFNVCVNVICRDACFAICLIKFLICSFLFYCSIVAVLYIVKYRLDNIDVIYVPISLWMNACRALGNYIANISNTFMEEKKQQKFDMPIVH